MVFCYKTITESPRRSTRSPSRSPTRRRTATWHSTLSGLEDDISSDFDSIPEREWRLLAALAKKRKEEDERKRMADQFHKMWLQEKEGREVMEAETAIQYRHFINKKRDHERLWNEHRQMLVTLEEHLQKGKLLDSIRRKDRKTEERLAWRGNKKASEMVNRALEDEARAFLAAERRCRQESASEWRKRIEMEETLRKADDAIKRRNEILRDYSRRLAINTVLNSWESALLRQELAASDEARRAQYSVLARMAVQRGERVNRARDLKTKRARAVAQKCQMWRDAVRMESY